MMNTSNTRQLGINNWEKFRYDKIFEIRKGFYNKKPDEDVQGNIPFVGATDSNNGITSWHTYEDIARASKDGKEKNQSIEDKIFDGNCICVTNNGSVGYAYYQETDFTCSHDVNPLYPNPAMGWKMNKYNALFLCCIIGQDKFRWAYGRKWRPERMAKSIISLPVTQDGTPDWQYMEDYIKRLYPRIPETKNISRNLQCNNENITINKNESISWKTFFVKDVFPILESTKGITVADMEDGDEIPYIAAKKESNGLDKLVARRGNEKYISKGNCIVFIQIGEGSAGYTTYQPGDFIGMRGKTLCGYNPLMNEYSGLFLETILDKERPKYSFGRSWTGDRLLNTKIQLPSTPEGTPDWQYMENYIKSLPYGDCLREYSEQEN